jgi:hypothetical protein
MLCRTYYVMSRIFVISRILYSVVETVLSLSVCVCVCVMPNVSLLLPSDLICGIINYFIHNLILYLYLCICLYALRITD